MLGYNKKFEHLDKREINIDSKETTQPFSVRKLKGEGMPVHNFPSQKGDLYIKFKVKLPKELKEEEKELIKEIFKD